MILPDSQAAYHTYYTYILTILTIHKRTITHKHHNHITTHTYINICKHNTHKSIDPNTQNTNPQTHQTTNPKKKKPMIDRATINTLSNTDLINTSCSRGRRQRRQPFDKSAAPSLPGDEGGRACRVTRLNSCKILRRAKELQWAPPYSPTLPKVEREIALAR